MAGTELDFDKMGQALDRVVAGLNKVDRSLQETGKQVVSFQTLFASSAGLDNLLTKLKALSEVDAQKFSRIGFGINQMAEALVYLSSVEASGNSFQFAQFATQVQALVSAFNVSAGAATSIKAVADALNALKAVSTVDLSKIVIPPELGDNLARLLGALTLLPDNDPSKKVGVIKKVFDGISGFFLGQFKAPAQAGLETAVSSISGIANALKTFETLSLDQGKVNSLIKTVAKMGVAFQGIGLLLKILPGGDAIENFSKTIQRLGIGLSGIARAAEQIDFNVLKKFVASVVVIGGVTKVLSVLLHFQDSKSVDAFANAISAIARVLQSVAKIDTIGTKSENTLNQIVPLIGKIVGSFTKLKGVKIPDLGPVVEGISNIIVALTAPGVTGERLDQIPGVVDKIAESLSKLNGVRASAPASRGDQVPGLTPQNATIALRNAILQVDILKKIADGFEFITRSVLNFQNAALNAFKTTGEQARQLGQTLLQQSQQIQNAFSLDALQKSGGFQVAQQFERTTSLLSAAGLNKDELKLAQDFADTIGIKYPLSANQALDSILALTKAGQDLANVQLILPAAADLAALTDTGDLNLVTQTLIGVAGAFSQFSDQVSGGFENINTAANLISAAADVSTASVESLSAGLANVGPSANAAGLDLQQTVAVLSEFEDANIRGAEAGTALRSVLNSIQSPKARDEFRRLGVATVNADGTLRDLNDIIQDVRASYDRLGLTEAQQQQSIAQLGDSFARQGLNVLLLRNGYEDTITAMGQTATAADKAAQSMDNLTGDTEQLRGSTETLVKDVLLPLIGRVFRPLTQVVLAATNAILTLPAPILDVATSVIQLVTTFGSLAAIGLTVAGVLTIIGGGFLELIGSIGLLILRLPILIAQFAAVGASLVVALPLIAAIGAAVVGLGTIIAQFYESVEQNIGGAGDAFNSFKESVTGVFEEVSRIAETALNTFNNFFGSFLDSGIAARGSAVAGFFNNLSTIFNNIRDTLAGIQRTDIEGFFRRISPFIDGLLNTFNQLGSGIFDLISGNFNRGLETIQSGITNVLSIATDAIQRITGLHLGDVVAAFNQGDLQRGLSNLFRSIVSIIQNLIRQNTPQIRAAFDVLLHFINPLNGVTTLLRILGLEDAANVVSGIADHINQIIGDAFSIVLRLVGGERLRDIFSIPIGGALERLLNSVQRLAQPIIDFFAELFAVFRGQAQNFGDTLSSQVDQIGPAIDRLAIFINNAADGLRAFLDPITQNLPAIISAVEDFASRLLSAFGPIIPFLQSVFGRIIENFNALALFFTGRLNLSDVVRTLVQNIIDTVKDLPNTLGQILSNLGQVLQSELLTNVGAAFQSGNVIGGIIGFATGLLREIYNRVSELFITVGHALGIDFVTAIGEQLQAGEILRALIAGLDGISSTIRYFFQQILDAVAAGTDQLAQNLGPIPGFFVRVFGGALQVLIQTTGIFKTQVLDFVSSILKIVDAILHIPGSEIIALITTLVGGITFFPEVILGALTTISSGIGAALTGIAGAVTGAIAAIIPAITTFLSTLAAAIVGLPALIGNSLIQLRDVIYKTIEANGGIVNILEKAVAKFAEFAAIVVILEAVGVAVHHLGEIFSGQENVFQGFLNFFVDLGANLLRLTHLDGIFTSIVDQIGNAFGVRLPATFDELIATVQNTANQIGTILQYGFNIALNAIGTALHNMVDQITIAIQDAFHRVEVLAGKGNAATTQFFAVGDAIANSASLTAEQFFSTLGDALANPQDQATLDAQLRQGATQIGQQFAGYITQGGSVADLAAQGLLDDVANTLASAGQIPQALSSLSGDLEGSFQLFNALNPEQQAANFNAFFLSVKDGASATSDGINALLHDIDTLQGTGAITAEQADIYRSQLTPSTREAQAALDSYTAAQQQAQAQTAATQNAAVSYSYTLDGLAESFSNASLSAEEMGSRFRDVVSGLTGDQINIQSLFDIYNQLSPEEAAASFGDFFSAAIRGGVARAGNEQYFQQLQTQIDNLRNSGLITGEQRRTFLDQMAQEAQTASSALADTTDAVNTLVDSYGRAKEVLGTTASTVVAPPTPPATVPPYDPNAAAAYTDDATNDISKKISDFAREEAKRIKNDLADEKKKAEEIEKLKNDSAKEELQKEKDYDLQTQRREEDHQKALQKIDDDYATQLEDAVANRDSAAAQTALKNKNKQIKDTEDQYKLESDRRQQDEDARRAQAEIERQEKIAQAEQDLQDLIAKHNSERLEREADFERELQDTKDKNAQIATQNQAAYAQQVATNAALVNNTKATTAQIGSAINAMLNSIKVTAAQVSGPAKSKSGFVDPFAKQNFSGIEVTPVGKDYSYGKGTGPSKGASAFGNLFGSIGADNGISSSGGFGGIQVGGGFGNDKFKQGSVAAFDNGGMTGNRAGLALLHPHEVVLNQANSKRYLANGGNTDNSSMVVNPQITINTSPGQSAEEIANIVEHRIITNTAAEIRSRTRGG